MLRDKPVLSLVTFRGVVHRVQALHLVYESQGTHRDLHSFPTRRSSDLGAVNFARRGFYPANVLKDLPDMYLERFFEPFEQGYHISKTLRQMVIFGHQDLSRGVPFPRISMVSCRNLLIYLKPELQQRVLDLFAYSLQHNNGYLFLGKAETARPSKGTFESVNKKWKIYRCLSGPLTIPANYDATRSFSAQTAQSYLDRQTISGRPNLTERQLSATEITP